jgi:hypothetical protein
MGCLFLIGTALAPRFVLFVIWVARPAVVNTVFDTWLVPLLGLIVLPYTTLLYLILAAPPFGMSSWDWVWIVIAAVLEFSHLGSAYDQRGRMRT